MGSSSVDDCYFYYYSSCTKGSDCPFRHCEAALGTETVCTLWREGMCYRSNCKFRHMESRINRSSIPCYWENQPGGCRKPHCVFFHHKDRSNLNVLTGTGLILPVSSQPGSPSKPVDSSADNKRESSESHSLSPSHPIQPVVVSLGEGEESDTESATGTPIKIISSIGKVTSSPQKSISVPAANVSSSEMDLGIKTLEQIRMEKIHRESEHFYNPDKTDADTSAECDILETMYDQSNGYYPQEYTTAANELTPSDSGMESYQNASLSPMEMNSIIQRSSNLPESVPGDLRHLLKKKRNVPEKEKLTKEPCTKRIISFKKSAAASEDLSEVVCVVKKQSRNEDDIGFRVKTLDEIRREKETKQGLGGKTAAEIPEEENDVSKPNTNLSYLVKGHTLENKVKPEGSKRKLRRKPLELYKPALKERNDMEENESVLEHYAAQVAENSMSDGEGGAKNISQEIIPQKEEKPFSFSLKRVCDSDVPIASKIRKTAALQRVPLQKLSTSGTGEEKPSRLVAKSQKNGNSLTFKRRNIIRRNIFNDLFSIQSNAMDEDFNSQLQTSDSQKELSLQTSELSVSSSQNGACMDSDDFHEKTEDIEMSEEKANNANNVASSPSVPVECENEMGSSTPSTVDEFDALFLGTESDICIDETCESTVPKAEDLFLEFEKIIQS